MLARNHARLEALRGIKKEFLEAKTAPGHQGDLTDEEGMKIISKLLKQRQDSAAIYRENNRPDLAEEDEAEAAVYLEFLPEPMSEEELHNRIQEIIHQLGVTDLKGMGQVMGVATKELAGKADGKAISAAVRSILQS